MKKIHSSRKAETKAMIKDFEDTDKTQTHAQTNKTPSVSNERDHRHAFVLQDQSVVRILDKNVENSKIFSCILKHEFGEVLLGLYHQRVCFVIGVANLGAVDGKDLFASKSFVFSFKDFSLQAVVADFRHFL